MRATAAIAPLLLAVLTLSASASVVQPCREPLEGVRRLGEARWIRTCAAQRGAVVPSALDACRQWLAACRKNPQHPLPAGTNSL